MNETRTMEAGIGKEFRDFGNAADILDPIGIGESEIPVEAKADVVAVEQVAVTARVGESALDMVGRGRLAGARQARKPQDAGLLVLLRGAQFPADIDCLAHQIGRPSQAERDHSGGHGAVGEAIDKDETSGFADLAVRIEGDRAVEGGYCRSRYR